MKKLNIIFYVIGTVCILIAIYIVFDKYFVKDDSISINFNEDEEIVDFNNKLNETGSSLGWIVLIDALNNQDGDGNYNVSFNSDLFDTYSYRQLFVMEYILSNTNNYDKFKVFDTSGNVVDDFPTSDMTYAYIDYDEFNTYYKSLFGEDFDITKSKNGNILYDNDYVYYENRRAGFNGVYVSMIQTDGIEYADGEYVSNVIITYSTRASELVGASTDRGVIKYIKDIDGNINFKSFVLKDR